jgi:hypothetical protein
MLPITSLLDHMTKRERTMLRINYWMLALAFALGLLLGYLA